MCLCLWDLSFSGLVCWLSEHFLMFSGDPSALVRLIHDGQLRLDRVEDHSEDELRTILDSCGVGLTPGSTKVCVCLGRKQVSHNKENLLPEFTVLFEQNSLHPLNCFIFSFLIATDFRVFSGILSDRPKQCSTSELEGE